MLEATSLRKRARVRKGLNSPSPRGAGSGQAGGVKGITGHTAEVSKEKRKSNLWSLNSQPAVHDRWHLCMEPVGLIPAAVGHKIMLETFTGSQNVGDTCCFYI
jgi:hypothetical protein